MVMIGWKLFFKDLKQQADKSCEMIWLERPIPS